MWKPLLLWRLLKGSLEAILNTGQFPAFCPQCRVDSGSNSSKPVSFGKIDEESLSFCNKELFRYNFLPLLNGAAQARAGTLQQQGAGLNNGNSLDAVNKLGVDGDDVRGRWRLRVRSWNCRNVPHSRAGSKIVHRFSWGKNSSCKAYKEGLVFMDEPNNLKESIKLRTQQSRPGDG